MYSLDCLDFLHLSVFLQSPSTFVCNHYCNFYIHLRSYNYSLSNIVDLLINISSRDVWIKQYINNIQIRLRIVNLCQRTSQRFKLKCQFI